MKIPRRNRGTAREIDTGRHRKPVGDQRFTLTVLGGGSGCIGSDARGRVGGRPRLIFISGIRAAVSFLLFRGSRSRYLSGAVSFPVSRPLSREILPRASFPYPVSLFFLWLLLSTLVHRRNIPGALSMRGEFSAFEGIPE